jgi:hypothetical protein
MTPPRKLGLALAALVLAGALAACSYADSAINERCVLYSGGTFEEKEFRKVLEPGRTMDGIGVGDAYYCYRTDQRSYIADANDDMGDTGPVSVVSNDDLRLLVEYQLYFKLNQETDVLRRFHENLGVKTQAWKQEGWVQMLREYFEPQISRALEAAALNYNWRDLYASEETRAAFNADTVRRVKENIKSVIGEDYFCGPGYDGPGDDCGDFTFTVAKPRVENQEVVAAIESEQTAAARTIAQEQENQRIAKELEAQRTIVELYGPQGALIWEAIKNGQIQMMVVPDGQSVAVPTR